MSERVRRLESVAAALAVALLALLFVWGASGLRGDAGRFPALVGGITALLALTEAGIRAVSRQVYGAPPRGQAEQRRRAALLLSWFAATLAGLYFLGVVPATAVFAALYFRLFAGWRLLPSLAAGGAMAAAFWIGFGLIAGFRLHQGTLSLPWP